jgi:hypothetical protein
VSGFPEASRHVAVKRPQGLVCVKKDPFFVYEMNRIDTYLVDVMLHDGRPGHNSRTNKKNLAVIFFSGVQLMPTRWSAGYTCIETSKIIQIPPGKADVRKY